MTKPNDNNSRPSGGGDSWSAAVVALHREGHRDLKDQGIDSKDVHSSAASEKGPAFRVTVTNGDDERGRNKHNSKTTRQPWNVTSNNVQPRPMSPVANALLSQPTASLTSSGHGTTDGGARNGKRGGRVNANGEGSEGKDEAANSAPATEKKPQREAPSCIYIEHEVLLTDTLQGLCLAYKISATRLRMENKFSGNSLQLAPKTLKIPIDPEKVKSLRLVKADRDAAGEKGEAAFDEKKSRSEETEEAALEEDPIKLTRESCSQEEEDKGVLSERILSDNAYLSHEEEMDPWMMPSGTRSPSSVAAEEEKSSFPDDDDDEEGGSLFALRVDDSKRLLRESVASLSIRVDDVLTRTERNFLETLLESNNPGVAEACVAARQRLMDGDLFWHAVGGRAAGGVGELEPVEVATLGAESGVYSCVSDLYSVGTSVQDAKEGEVLQFVPQCDEDLCDEMKRGSKDIVVLSRSEDIVVPSKSADSATAVVPPASVAVETPAAITDNCLENSTKERLDRLEERRRQSNRLLRAHEAGLVVTPAGSARRSLARMGLPMGEVSYGASPPPRMPLSPMEDDGRSKGDSSAEETEQQAVDDILSSFSNAVKVEEGDNAVIEQAMFEKALAKMDERTLRRMEKEEKKKGNLWSSETEMAVARPSAPNVYAGCITPFGMGLLRTHFASKQFSIQRETSHSSSYTRYDSFLLNATETVESDGLLFRGNATDNDDDTDNDSLLDAAMDTGFLDDSDNDSDNDNESDNDFLLDAAMDTGFLNNSVRKRKKVSDDERLRNILVNAGFKDTKSYDTTDTLVLEASPEDDEDILALSARSTNTVAMLMRGGPSYRNVDMFRGAGDDEEVDDEKKMQKKNEFPDEKGLNGPPLENLNTSNVSFGAKQSSPPAAAAVVAADDMKGNPTDDDASDGDVSIPSLHSDLGELPSLLPPLPAVDRLSQSARAPRSSARRRATIGIMKTSSSNNSGATKKYKRSVSWNRRVFAKEDAKDAARASAAALKRQDSASDGLSVISFPNLATALPIIRSNSIVSESMTSVLSHIPTLSHAQPVRSPRGSSSVATAGPPLISHAHSIRSDFGEPMTDHLDECSLNSEYCIGPGPSRPKRAVWESPLVSAKDKKKNNKARNVSSSAGGDGEGDKEEHLVFIHPTSQTRNYEGVGMEIENFPQATVVVPAIETMGSDAHERYQNMISIIDDSVRSTRSLMAQRFDDSFRSNRSLAQRFDDSVRSARTNNNSWTNRFHFDESLRSSPGRGLSLSGRSRRGSANSRTDAPPITSLDDSFVIKNIHFERHTSEILRSLSNEDLMSTCHLKTTDGGLTRGCKHNEPSPAAHEIGNMLSNAGSWEDLESNPSFPMTSVNAWPVLEDECAEGYNGALLFRILGTSASDKECHPHVLSPPLMETLQNFLPPAVSFYNFWLKYSLVRDGPSLPSLLRNIRGSKDTLVAIETVGGEVFGSFTSSPWRKNRSHCCDGGDEEAFLWRMRRTRAAKDAQRSVLDQARLESELDVYHWAGRMDDWVQYCTKDILAVGRGGPLSNEQVDGEDGRELPPQKPVLSKAAEEVGGFGLSIDADLLSGTSSSCAAFRNPPLSASCPDGSPFKILNIEVWTMTPCSNIDDAENLEMRNLFLEG
eukprot:CAMPEP_0172531448 /NCGR_PEP_ID=MMETSP1067-20121228/4856_1 /TAXON_ID=265564 ORGANISM="Thalassiosira punctigera, Strain Tpunct2005C2" /NCGR_SAMPLE_ID=MMETSP1067 /ASSEMBLY_ACC=CAM_ASM_000444 /LENGTH=1630 /DNA_ID=CAMNT_0013315829 /DNA_START=141 /DNA_END=5033 /DNA_ORIENTATION=+